MTMIYNSIIKQKYTRSENLRKFKKNAVKTLQYNIEKIMICVFFEKILFLSLSITSSAFTNYHIIQKL